MRVAVIRQRERICEAGRVSARMTDYRYEPSFYPTIISSHRAVLTNLPASSSSIGAMVTVPTSILMWTFTARFLLPATREMCALCLQTAMLLEQESVSRFTSPCFAEFF